MKIHIVREGETLWKIAQKYNVNFEKLKEVNSHLADPDSLMPGMKIKIPTQAQPVKMETVTDKVIQKAPLKKEAVNPYKDTSKPAFPVMKEDDVKKPKEILNKLPHHPFTDLSKDEVSAKVDKVGGKVSDYKAKPLWDEGKYEKGNLDAKQKKIVKKPAYHAPAPVPEIEETQEPAYTAPAPMPQVPQYNEPAPMQQVPQYNEPMPGYTATVNPYPTYPQQPVIPYYAYPSAPYCAPTNPVPYPVQQQLGPNPGVGGYPNPHHGYPAGPHQHLDWAESSSSPKGYPGLNPAEEGYPPHVAQPANWQNYLPGQQGPAGYVHPPVHGAPAPKSGCCGDPVYPNYGGYQGYPSWQPETPAGWNGVGYPYPEPYEFNPTFPNFREDDEEESD
ncbi:LysM peptidoglycan-binding domain-containing protein [Radiobacillus kanasensis]|uniref:LysM peptidoglycan-binding domain-containing protein n=1 Tax=Radiobacillus kanasensis TaxID=2844358 RepID=UPI001E56317B|nr:LysM peptidoglycan-binding domain-containing protein [Radiobacillus kanasensis]UFT97906.1 LysM peptidoglycan-binding domain-containing protein [Radiobacillus kanasensis]